MSEKSKDRDIVHCKTGGKVVIEGSRVEIHLPGPVVVQRKQWTCYFDPREEVRRTLAYSSTDTIKNMLEEAFQAVPMVAHPEDD